MIWIDGAWQDKAVIDAADRGFLLGDGLFETLLWRDGTIVRFERHQARMRSSADALGFEDPFNGVDLAALAAEAADRLQAKRLALRFTLSAGAGPRGLERGDGPPVRMLSAVPVAAPPARQSLALVSIRRSAVSITARHKTLSYADNLQARREARTAGAAMGLLLDTRGYLSGADCANLFWSIEGQWYTPALECAVLPGTARAELLTRFNVFEVCAAPSELFRAECVALTNALMGSCGVTAIGERALRLDTDKLDALRRALS